MGCFITFEGIEGCGKTTQIKRLALLLENKGYRITTTREPGGCPIADRIRSILLDGESKAITPLTELLLFAAARAQHVAEVIAPALAAGSIVLCDRYTDATLAYQGFGRQLDKQLVKSLNSLAVSGATPDLTIILDLAVETGLGRAVSPVNMHDVKEERFELESSEFHGRVRSGYLELAALEPMRFCVIPADGTIEEVGDKIACAVMARVSGA